MTLMNLTMLTAGLLLGLGLGFVLCSRALWWRTRIREENEARRRGHRQGCGRVHDWRYYGETVISHSPTLLVYEFRCVNCNLLYHAKSSIAHYYPKPETKPNSIQDVI